MNRESTMWIQGWRPLRGTATQRIVIDAIDGNSIGPANRLEVSNQYGRFGWRVKRVDCVTQELAYAWTNPGTVANLSKASSLRSGHARVRILDAMGTEVYDGRLAENGMFWTSPGMRGRWTVIISLRCASGRFNFCLGSP
jgi:hypothetical protein